MTGGAGLFASTFGKGNAGSVNILARELVSDGATSSGEATGAFSSVAQPGTGNAGDINIQTRSFSLTGGAGLFALTEGTGNAGDITVNVADVANFSGVSAFGLASGLVTSTTDTVSGQGGNITIIAGILSIRDGAVSSARTYNEWNGGNITVNANTLELANGGKLLTTAYSSGRAGNTIINATDRITISGSDPTFADRLAQGRLVYPISASSGLFANTETNSTGQGGGIRITTGQLILRNGGQVAVNSTGLGNAGSIEAIADSIDLDDRATISADTRAGQGNINLDSGDLILRRGSSITTNATGSNNIGGNITIDTDNLVAVPQEDSDISANSIDFRGGNVTINAYAIFGIQPRSQLTPLSDITATGATSALAGTLDVTTAAIEPMGGLVVLPTDVLDASRLIATGCPASQGNSFVITGRGGLPPTPSQQLDDDAEWLDRRRLTVAQDKPTETDGSSQHSADRIGTRHPAAHPPLIEATGWQLTSTGQVKLVATTPDPTVYNSLHQPVACNGRQ